MHYCDGLNWIDNVCLVEYGLVRVQTEKENYNQMQDQHV